MIKYLNRIPASQSRGEVDVASETKVCGIENLVGARVVQDSFGMNASFMSESTEASDGVVEGRVDLYRFSYHVLNLNMVSS